MSIASPSSLRNVIPPTTRLLAAFATNPISTPHTRRPYHSIYHPPAPPFPPTQETLLSAAYAAVPTHGFTLTALQAGLSAHSYPLVSQQLFPRGPYNLINYHLVTQRLALKSTIQFPPSSPLSLQAKLKALTWARLQANAPIIPHWENALSQMSLLENIPPSLEELAKLSDEIWYLAGDTDVSFGWYTKRAQLAMVYASTEVFMTGDRSEGFKETERFLERRFEDVMGVGKAIGGLGEWAGFWAGNGVGLARSWGLKV